MIQFNIGWGRVLFPATYVSLTRIPRLSSKLVPKVFRMGGDRSLLIMLLRLRVYHSWGRRSSWGIAGTCFICIVPLIESEGLWKRKASLSRTRFRLWQQLIG